MAAPSKKPVLVQLDMDFTDGGASPWFNAKGRSVVASLTSKPEDAELFNELARDGTMGALISYLDTEQSSVSNVVQLCYILTVLVLFTLFLLLPLGVSKLSKYTSGVGIIPWLIYELILVGAASGQLHCLLCMISTWYGMDDGLSAKAPQAYRWTFELLRNYTQLTIQLLKEAKDPDKNLDKTLRTTTNGIKSLQANLSAWEDRYTGYASLKHMLTGPLAVFQMGLLGLAVAISVSSALVAGGTWFRRARNLEKEGSGPVYVATFVTGGAILLLTHLAIVLPMIARWLPVCVLAETYLCRPYRDGSFGVLDDGVANVWPLATRPEPFCRLVPSTLFAKCSAKGKAGIKALPACLEKSGKKALEFTGTAAQLLQQPHTDDSVASKTNVPLGDCFYPYKVIDTDLKSVCPLFTDDLLGYWMAMVLSAIFGIVNALAATAIALIFWATRPKKAVKKHIKKKLVRRKRSKRRKKKPKAPRTPSPPQPHYACSQPINIDVNVPAPVSVAVRHMSQHGLHGLVAPFVLLQPPPPPYPQQRLQPSSPALLQTPLRLSSQMVIPTVAPTIAPEVVATSSGERQKSAVPHTSINVHSSGGIWACSPSAGVPLATPQLGQLAMASRRPVVTLLLSSQLGGTTMPLPQRPWVPVSTLSWSTDTQGSSSESQVSVGALVPSSSLFQAVVGTTQPEDMER